MKARKTIGAAILLIAAVSATRVLWAQEIPAEYQQVLTITGKSGDYKANVLKVNVLRNDLHITVDKVALPTPFGFGGWFAMTKGDGGDDVMMGDLVLLQEEVNPVMSALLANGLEVTALHNHFFWEEPRLCYMHLHGHGRAANLAKQLKPALDLIGKGASSQPAAKPRRGQQLLSTQRKSQRSSVTKASRVARSTRSLSVATISSWKKWVQPSMHVWA